MELAVRRVRWHESLASFPQMSLGCAHVSAGFLICLCGLFQCSSGAEGSPAGTSEHFVEE